MNLYGYVRGNPVRLSDPSGNAGALPECDDQIDYNLPNQDVKALPDNPTLGGMRGNASGFFSPDASAVSDLRPELQLKELNKQADAEQQQAELDLLARGSQQFISTPGYARNHIMVDKLAQDYAREVKFYNDPKLETPVLGDIRKIAHHFERGEVAQGMGDALVAGVTYAPFAKAIGGLKTAATQAIERNVAKRATTKSAGQIGKEGEAYVSQVLGQTKNTIKIPVNGRDRIPDFISDVKLSEVKNVQRLSYTSQLRDFNKIAQQQGLQYNVWIRQGTQMSSPLKSLAGDGYNGTINFIKLPW